MFRYLVAGIVISATLHPTPAVAQIGTQGVATAPTASTPERGDTLAPANDADPMRLAARRGFTTSLGFTGSRLILPSRTAAELADAGIDTDSRGLGAELRVGYAFSPAFALSLRLGASHHTGSIPNEDVHLAHAAIEMAVHTRPHAVLDPFLFASLGGAVIGFGEKPIDETAFEAGMFSTGLGADVRLSRHFGATVRYRYDLYDIERQQVIVPGSGRGPIDVAGDAEAHTIGYQVTYRY